MPFDALKGLQEALREKEKELEFEEKRMEIAMLLNKVVKDVKLKVVYYSGKRYVEYVGAVLKLDYVRKKILFEDGTFVFIDDILKLEML